MEPFARQMAAKKVISEEEAKEQEKKKKKDENFIDNSWTKRFLGELLPYLGGNKYFQMCVMCMNYETGMKVTQINDSLEELRPLEPDEDMP